MATRSFYHIKFRESFGFYPAMIKFSQKDLPEGHLTNNGGDSVFKWGEGDAEKIPNFPNQARNFQQIHGGNFPKTNPFAKLRRQFSAKPQ